jgi:hypothetical protein
MLPNVFLGNILLGLSAALSLPARRPTDPAVIRASIACVVSRLLPGLAMGCCKWAVRCAHCGCRRHQRPLHSFAGLTRMADPAAGQPDV